MVTGSARIIRGNALALPLADASVDLIVTSPPYFGLRSYQDDGAHYAGQIGSEATPAEFVDALIAATREMVRVLKPSGSIWVNLGDKYNSAAGGQNGTGRSNLKGHGGSGTERDRHSSLSARGVALPLISTKSLIGIPWRYALRCIDELGLILRAEIIWAKPNGLPESVTDRVRRSHEQWFHFTREPRYYSAVDEIREEHADFNRGGGVARMQSGMANGQPRHTSLSSTDGHPLGKLPGSVWSIPTQPLTVPPELGVDHFAAFPMEWPRRIIQGWSPAGVCTVCGEGRRPVVDKALEVRQRHLTDRQDRNGDNQWGTSWRELGGATVATIAGYACACVDEPCQVHHVRRCTICIPPRTRRSVILDPFGGTGTTALVAKALGRIGISVDMSADYCRLAEWRCNDPGQMAAALEVERPEPVPPDQLDLFSEVPV